MSTTSFAWLTIFLFSLCFHYVVSENLRFLKIPNRQILPLGSNLILNCTTNSRTANTTLYYRRKTQKPKWKKVETIPGKVVQDDQVYTLMNVTRKQKGQYQCRAMGLTNSTEIRWPDNVGIFRELSNKGPKKPGPKITNRKKRPGSKRRPGPTKRPGSKRRPGPTKRPGSKRRPRPTKRPGSKRGPGPTKRLGSKRRPRPTRLGSKRRPKPTRPGSKRRPKPTKRLGSKRRPRPTRPGGRGSRKKQKGKRKPGKKRPGSKKKPKQGPHLKVLRKTVTVNAGSLAVMKCIVRVEGGDEQPVISWYRSQKLIGCSSKKNSACSSISSPYLINYRVHPNKGGKIKTASYLKIAKTKRARDQGSYKCVASNKQGSSRQTIRLTVNKGS